MQIRGAARLLLAVTLTSGCESAETASLDTDDQKTSYAIGLDIGSSLKPGADMIDRAALLKGIEDAFSESEPALSPEELQISQQRFFQTVQATQDQERAEIAQRNQVEGEAFLAENSQKEGVITTDSGLQYEVLRDGDGDRPVPGESVMIHYRGTLIDGTQFDSSYDGEPLTLGVTQFIAGFSEGLQLMTAGSQYRLVIPGDIAYGSGGSGPQIGPNTTLIFEIELIDIPR